ncbi:MAG: GTPase ObgE [Verrucomicrobia bacterium]|nr:GTPase ObgE [Verrucomicrobiota bacterium]
MFIDEAKVILKSGDGGHGCVSFRREKFIPKGGPDGGNGGKGGDIVLLCDRNEGDLQAYRWQPHRSARNGTPGMGRQCAGPDGTDLIMPVPPGTQVLEEGTGRLVAELTEHGDRVVLLAGGKGGLGNMNFKSSVNQAPRRTTPGYPGEKGEFRLVLKTIADIGLVGYPNAGKSTLTNLLTAARPKTAPYPFTTLHVNVGVIEYPDRFDRIVMADIPGLIEGAHDNRGLGHQFLRHIERCTLLVFIIDMAGSENRKPWDDFQVLERELRLYSQVLAGKPRVIVANKLDLPDAPKYLKEFQARVKERVIPISCFSGDGLEDLRTQLWNAVKGPVDQRPKAPVPVVHELPKKAPAKPAAPKAKAKPATKAKAVKPAKKAKAKPVKKVVVKKAVVKKAPAKKITPKAKAKPVVKKPVAKKKAAPVKQAAVRTKAKKK